MQQILRISESVWTLVIACDTEINLNEEAPVCWSWILHKRNSLTWKKLCLAQKWSIVVVSWVSQRWWSWAPIQTKTACLEYFEEDARKQNLWNQLMTHLGTPDFWSLTTAQVSSAASPHWRVERSWWCWPYDCFGVLRALGTLQKSAKPVILSERSVSPRNFQKALTCKWSHKYFDWVQPWECIWDVVPFYLCRL